MIKEKITVKKLCARYEKSERTVFNMIKDGRLPPPIDPETKPLEWYLEEIIEHEHNRKVYL